MIKVSDFVADFLARQGITQVFTITGGGAMGYAGALNKQQLRQLSMKIMS